MNLFLEINNYCNAGCIFCVADTGLIHPRRALSYATIEKILQKHNIGVGDAVFVTGGEPLIHPEIIDIMESIRKRKAYFYATVFGTSLEDREFCRKILNTGINRLAIPVYGSNEKVHDFVTKVPGSFRAIEKGLGNLFELRDEIGARTKIEVRTLVCKANYMDIPKIVKYIKSKFEKVDIFGISGLQVSIRALKWEKDAVIRIKEISGPVREALDILSVSRTKTVITNLPLCIVGKEYINFYENLSVKETKDITSSSQERIKVNLFPHISYGPWMTENDGTERESSSKRKGESCKSCSFYEKCSGIDRRYVERFGFEDIIPIC